MMIRKTAPAIFALGVLAAACLPAAAQQPAATVDAAVATAPGKAVVGQVIKTTATITHIDKDTRTVKMKRQDGKQVEMVLGEEAHNFDQLKVGDRVHAEYTEAVALELKKGGGGAPEVKGGESVQRSEKGGQPGGKATRQVSVLADVVKVDHKKMLVTLKGPGGNLVDLAVEDPEQLKNIKKGDQVHALYTESLAIRVEPAKK
jgi:Cu/Ag efflux protein CusF